MEIIKINGKSYKILQNIDDLTFGDWLEITEIFTRREYKIHIFKKNYKEGDELNEEDYVKEEIPFEKESEQFRDERRIDLIQFLSGVPKEFLINYPSLPDELESLVEWDNLLIDKTDVKEKITVYGEDYEVIRPSKGTFQMWCDAESYKKLNYANILLVYLKDSKGYDRFFRNYDIKLQSILSENAKGLVSLFNSLLDEMATIRSEFKFVYSAEELQSDKKTVNMSVHYERFGWYDIIHSLAKSQVFNGVNGSLEAVRNKNTIEILDYLNIERSKDIAEYKDYLANNNENKKIL